MNFQFETYKPIMKAASTPVVVTPCTSPSECANADGEFCNGSETCDGNGVCQPGTPPCAGQICVEASETCVECIESNDCSSTFCIPETCQAGSCQAGSSPCASGCDANAEACLCTVATDCNEGEECVSGVCTVPSACNDNNVCEEGEDCTNCADCAGRTGGKPSDRFCCGDGTVDGAEGNGDICDGNN